MLPGSPDETAGLALALAALWDLVLGEPPASIHPVVWIGTAARPLLALRQRRLPPWMAFLVGAAVTLALGFGAALAMVLLLRALGPWPWLSMVLQVYLVGSLFAVGSLLSAGRRLAEALARRDLPAARAAVGHLCSRDPASLSEAGLASAGIESLSENTHDSVVAPLFFYALGGLPALAFYRVVNTLDAMVGYRDDREYLGKAAARLDDLLNFLPARLSALCLALAAGGRLDWRGLWRDAATPAGPNSGWPMAVASATLGVRLEKTGSYTLGATRPLPRGSDVQSALRLVRRASVAWTACVVIFVTWQGGPLVRFGIA